MDSQITHRRPSRSSPPSTTPARDRSEQLLGISRNDCSGSIGTDARDQLESLLGITRCAHIGVFFFALRGRSPPEAWQIQADFSVTWLLLTYIWVQMRSLILVGAGTKKPDVARCLHFSSTVISNLLRADPALQRLHRTLAFQAKTASVTAYTTLLDFVVDLAAFNARCVSPIWSTIARSKPSSTRGCSR